MYGAVDAQIHDFITSTLLEFSGQFRVPAALPPSRKLLVTIPCSRGGLDDVESSKIVTLTGLVPLDYSSGAEV
jgi:hypothetical protein